MKSARFVAAARAEFLDEVAYYREIQPSLAERFVAAVESAVARALVFPQAGSPAAAATRRVFLKNFPFSVVYRAVADDIVVFAVAHQARRPAYWRARVKSETAGPE